MMQLTGIGGGIGSREAQGAPSPRLVRAAQEFEGQMMKELLKPMTDGDAPTGVNDETGSGGVLGEFASETLGRSLSERGGFGIAARIIRELSHTSNQPESGKVIRNLNRKHALRASQ